MADANDVNKAMSNGIPPPPFELPVSDDHSPLLFCFDMLI